MANVVSSDINEYVEFHVACFAHISLSMKKNESTVMNKIHLIPMWSEDTLPASVRYHGERDWDLPEGWNWEHLKGDDTVSDLGDERAKALGGDVWVLFDERRNEYLVYTNEWRNEK